MTLEVNEMIKYGYALGLTEEQINGLIIRSYRTLKQENAIAAKVRMRNLDDCIKTRNGIPYCFKVSSQYLTIEAHYNALKTEFHSRIINKFGLSKYGKVEMTGSMYTKIPPPDFDSAMYLTQEQTIKLYNEMETIADKAVEMKIWNPKEEKKFKSGMKNYYNKKLYVDNQYIIAIDESGTQAKVISLELELRELSIIESLNLSKTPKKIDFHIYNISENPFRRMAPSFELK